MMPCILDCQNNVVYLLKRLMYREEVVGAVYLLGNLFVIAKGSCPVLVHAGHSPYDLKDKIYVDGMKAVDIATSYSDICVYVLDDGNGRVSRIGQNHKLSTTVDGLEPGNLQSMSVTKNGCLIIVDKSSKILIYGKDGKLISIISVPLGCICHAVEVASENIVVCKESALENITKEGELLRSNDMNGISCISLDRKGNLIISNRCNVVQLDAESLQETVTLLTLDRDGIERPKHVQYVLENGMLLVSWENCVDIYSFRQEDTRGYLACSEDDIRNQQTLEAMMLEKEIERMNAYRDLYRTSGVDCDVSDLVQQPQALELQPASSLGKNDAFLWRVSMRPHAQRDIVLPFLSVRHVVLLYLNERIYRQTSSVICQGHHSTFVEPTAVTKCQRNL